MSVGIILPVSVGGTASGWVVTDYRTVERSSAPVTTAGGTASIDLNPLDDDTRWVIDHAVISCTSTTPSTLRWYADTVAPAQLLDGSATGNFDVADWPRGLQLEPQRALLMRWTGCSAGAIASVNLQATVMRRA